MEMIKMTDSMHKARKQRNCLLHPTPNPYPFLLPNTHIRELPRKELSSQEPRVEGWVDCGAEMKLDTVPGFALLGCQKAQWLRSLVLVSSYQIWDS